MKKIILNIIFLIISVLSYGHGIYCTSSQITRSSSTNMSYNNSYNYNNRYANNTVMYSTPSIGYSTNISGLNRGIIRYNNYYKSSYRQTNSFYTGTYTPNTTPTGSSGPRRITVYDGNGNTAETPGGSSDQEGIYQYDESTGKWYYSPDNGNTWYEWRRASGIWELFVGLFGGGWGSDWRTINNPPSENSGHWASDPEDPFLTPVGEFPIGLLLLLMFSYLFYKINNKRTKKL